MKYKLEVTEEQLLLLHHAVEECFRVRMGQFDMIANDLAFIGYNGTQDDFDRRIISRDWLQEFLEFWGRKCLPHGIPKSDEINNLIDMWHVIEHQQWLDNPDRISWDRASCEPFPVGTEEMMRIERIKK